MHDRNFMAADRQICLLLDALHEAYEMHCAIFCRRSLLLKVGTTPMPCSSELASTLLVIGL